MLLSSFSEEKKWSMIKMTWKNLAVKQLLRRRSQDTDALRKKKSLEKKSRTQFASICTSKMHFMFVFVLFWMLLLKASVVSSALNKKRLHQNMQVLIFNKNASSLCAAGWKWNLGSFLKAMFDHLGAPANWDTCHLYMSAL